MVLSIIFHFHPFNLRHIYIVSTIVSAAGGEDLKNKLVINSLRLFNNKGCLNYTVKKKSRKNSRIASLELHLVKMLREKRQFLYLTSGKNMLNFFL